MDTNSQRTSQVLHSPATHYHLGGDSLVEHPTLTELCTLCRRRLSPDNDDLDAVSICGDCKFLLLEDLGTPTRDFDRRRSPRPRRTRHASSESNEELFSQQLSHMINLARQNQLPFTWQDNQLIDDDASGTSLRYTSARTTPNGSRRWRHLLSDTESESFDYLDSLYGESEISISRYRPFNSENDTISFSAHGGDSDASVDGRVLMDREMLIEPDDGSDVDSDTDIDPMHTGFSQWNSDDLEDDEEEEEEGGWEEADIAEGTQESGEAGVQLHNFLSSNQSEGNDHVNWYQQPHPFEFEGLRNWRIRGGRQAYNHGIFENLVESDLLAHRRNSGDYLDATGFEELLENLAGIDNSRRGAPPAAVSVVKSLPRIIIDEKHAKCDNLACAICKDVLLVGTEVNQLPCLHLYHPSCILRWLRARNSCPLCRYELPTDDKDYDEQKQRIRERLGISDIRQQDVRVDTSADASDRAQTLPAYEIVQVGVEQADVLDMDIDSSSIGSEGRSRWFLLAAAPIVGLVGFVLVLWLGKSEKRELISHSFAERGMHQIQVPATSPPNQRDSRGKRWWSIFEWFSS
ncbi:hypothetical protein K2173_008164 [Erythroxylum novogranatense]|uniref:RING-type E3 ubiquitin transferase n=1 Tax=Erythroxylum novogranatense TaxID=1862640 RepID=A0AAV8U8L9_9ROSI|nr:hypothetical protein K2173_008164 [Erythroxylum novogranatense]